MEIIETSIDGLIMRLNKVVKDERGFLVELAPLGSEDPFLKAGIQNIYASTANRKGVKRGGHFHKRNVENFFTLSGTSLWLFIDCRPESPTFNNFHMVILGSKKPSFEVDVPFYTIDDSKMAQILIPTGVYHVYWPLTDETVTALAIASESYEKNKDDYHAVDLNKYTEIKNYLSKFGIQV